MERRTFLRTAVVGSSAAAFGGTLWRGVASAAPAQPAKGTPLLIDVSSPIFSTPAKLRRDVATSPLLAGQRSPLSRNVDASDVAQAATYLLAAPNVTGSTVYVDAGYHAMGM